jgi:ABC-type Fe3+-hydroxamate transport system substrate-binding protein
MSEAPLVDDLGAPVRLTGPARRVVSLVPSLTESVAATGTLVGATDWCTHPADLDVTRVRGTKNPDVRAIVGLRPDVVLAVQEENRELDVRRLREAGVPVWVSVVETVPQALDVLDRIFDTLLQVDRPGWLGQARSLWAHDVPAPTVRVAVPVWRDPWMVVGRDTFTGDLLARLGWDNVFAGSPDRYPQVQVGDIDRADVDVVLLPDEPYVFTADDGPEAFSRARPVLVRGRLLTWYGPSLVAAHDLRLSL